jgi:hypothetical protein
MTVTDYVNGGYTSRIIYATVIQIMQVTTTMTMLEITQHVMMFPCETICTAVSSFQLFPLFLFQFMVLFPIESSSLRRSESLVQSIYDFELSATVWRFMVTVSKLTLTKHKGRKVTFLP